MMEFVASLVISFLLGVATSWYFGRQNSKELDQRIAELKEDNANLRHENQITLSALSNTGMFNPKRDEHGTIVGTIHMVSGAGIAQLSTGSGPGLTTTPPDDGTSTS